MIVDTTVFIDLLKGNTSAVSKIQSFYDAAIPLTTTSVSVFELWRGFNAVNQESRRRASALLTSMVIHPLSVSAARTGGELAQTLDRKGQSVNPEDLMIAGIAKEQNEPILTRNRKHFERIEGLTVHSY